MLVRLHSMAGSMLEVEMHLDESLSCLRQQACQLLGIFAWQLQLLHKGEHFPKSGYLRDHVRDDDTCLELLAVAMATCPKAEASENLGVPMFGLCGNFVVVALHFQVHTLLVSSFFPCHYWKPGAGQE